MSTGNDNTSGLLGSALKAGSAAAALCLLLLIIPSVLVFTGGIPEETGKIGVYFAMAAAALIVRCALPWEQGSGGAAKSALASVIVYVLLLLITAGTKQGRLEPAGAIPSCASALLGYTMGGFMKINKKYTGKKKYRRKYNK